MINRGFSGYTSSHLSTMLPQMLLNDNQPYGIIKVATVLLGSNDAVNKSLDNRHVPIADYVKNLKCIISLLQKAQVDNIILISPPPVDDFEWDKCMKFMFGELVK